MSGSVRKNIIKTLLVAIRMIVIAGPVQANAENQQSEVISDGYYQIQSALYRNLVLDISGASKKNGGNAQIYSNNGTDAQIFLFTEQQ